MAYNLERIKAEITDICENAGFRGVKYLNISINPRLSTTLGRVKYRANPIYPYAIEFSKNFIENNTDEDIHEVIMHECAHAIVTVRTKEKHGHDNILRRFVLNWERLTIRCILILIKENRKSKYINIRYIVKIVVNW